MHLEVYVEERSMELVLNNLFRELLPEGCDAKTYSYRGKNQLLSRLPGRLKQYAHGMPEDWRIVVLVDRDSEDCQELKRRLDGIAEVAGLVPKSRAGGGPFHVLNRIAIEELEAWFFGDVEALRAAYPHVPETLAARAGFRDPDSIRGGTWEALAGVLGYTRDSFPKIAVARAVSQQMDPERNRSHSFQVFCSGIADLVIGGA